MGKTKIEWTHAAGRVGMSWNPVRGCRRISAGCEHCYAETMAARFSGPGLPFEGVITNGRWNGKVEPLPEKLAEPLRWRKPRMVLVGSMSDLFHEDVPNEFIENIVGVMAACPDHIFQVLTKRPERMRRLLSEREMTPEMVEAVGGQLFQQSTLHREGIMSVGQSGHPSWITVEHAGGSYAIPTLPLLNAILMTSVENQKQADARIPHLLATPAAVRGVSIEPMLEEIELPGLRCDGCGYTSRDKRKLGDHHLCKAPSPTLDWVIAGSESGPRRRPADPDWFRSLRDQCVDAGVSFFLKQMHIDGKKVSLPELDGRKWAEMPEMEERGWRP